MKTVLIADDAAFMRLTLKKLLSENGFDVVAEAENGVVAVDKYKEYKPDIVTMDITMPEMSGIEALKKIIESDPEAKVIIVSAMGQEHLVREAIVCGAKSFVVKPFKPENFMKVISKVSIN